MTAGANQKVWRWISEPDGSLHIQTVNDAYTANNDVLAFSRSGATPTLVTVSAPTIVNAGTTAGRLETRRSSAATMGQPKAARSN